MSITQQEMIDYLMGVIEDGSDADLLELYNAYTKLGLTMEQVDW